MKKFTAIVLALAILLTFCACGAKNRTETDDEITVAIVQPLSHTSLNQIRDTIKTQLEASGLNIKVETADANNDTSAFTTIISNYKAEGVDIIVPIATSMATTAKTVFEGADTPIVFAAVSDPVSAGLTGDGCENITGVSDNVPADGSIELIKEFQPDLQKIGFLYTSSEINSVALIGAAEDYCDSNGIAYEEATIGDLSELQAATQSLVAKGVDAFYTCSDNTIASAMTAYTDIAYNAGIPVYCGADSMVADGGFATVGVNYVQLGKQVADIVLEIAGGKAPSEIPYQTLTEFSKFINLSSAEKIGFTVSDELLASCTVLVEADGTSHFGE